MKAAHSRSPVSSNVFASPTLVPWDILRPLTGIALNRRGRESSSVTIELVVGNPAGTQPLPPWRILFHEPRRHECGREFFRWIAPLSVRGLLLRRHIHSDFERCNREKFFVDQSCTRHVAV